MTYPPAPWHTHGHAVMQPYLVDARSLHLPAGFEPVTIGGRVVGVLGLVVYEPPSPLVYAELVWMPCMVTVATEARRARGYYVDKMYVDSDDSLAGGRELWALPKQKARFELGAREAIVETDDGARLVLDVRRRGPRVRAPVSGATLQDAGAIHDAGTIHDAGAAQDAGGAEEKQEKQEIVRFRGSGIAHLGSARLEVREARGLDGWMGWTGARRMAGLGMAIDAFAITMHAPKRLRRA